MIHNKFVLSIFLTCIALSPRPAPAQTVVADISSDEAIVGESLVVQVRVINPGTASAPEPPTTGDFDIQMDTNPPGTNQSVQIINGQMSSQVDYTYRFYVRPKREGVLILPAFTRKEGGAVYRSAPIKVRVGRSVQTEDVVSFVKSKSQTAYIGQAVDLTLEIWIKKYYQRDIGTLQPETLWRLKDLNASNLGVFSSADINRPALRQDRRRDAGGIAHDYFVFALETTTFPSQPGKIDFSDIQFTMHYPLQIGQSMLSLTLERKRIVTAKPKADAIDIRPLPTEGRPPDFSGAIGNYRITATAKPTEVPVGDPITLTYAIYGDGPLERLRPPKLDKVKTLTDDFEISGESLGGEVESGRKVFTQTIRALREDVEGIPPIPFSYFDPEAGKYSVAHSSAIPLKVRPAQRVVLTGGPAQVQTQQSVLAPLSGSTDGLLPNVSDPRLVLADQSASIGTGSLTLIVLMPAAYLGAWLVQRRSARFRDNEALRRRNQARPTAAKRLKAANSPGHVRSALIGYVADRCNVPAGGLTRAEVSVLLRERSASDELIGRVDGLLDTLEQSEYGGGAGQATRRLADMAQSAITELERHLKR